VNAEEFEEYLANAHLTDILREVVVPALEQVVDDIRDALERGFEAPNLGVARMALRLSKSLLE